MSHNKPSIAIVMPSGPTKFECDFDQQLARSFSDFQVDSIEPVSGCSWPYTSASAQSRTQILSHALMSDKYQIIWARRGGYGASELIEQLPYESLKKTTPKLLVGFSDFCAIQSALYTKLGWPCMHAPMPDAKFWSPENKDVKQSLKLVCSHDPKGQLQIENPNDEEFEAILFGGCLSVLTQLIGTNYLPSNFHDHLLLFEDIGENPAKICRYLMQWKQSGLLQGTKGIVLGDLVHLTAQDPSKSLSQQDLDKKYYQDKQQLMKYLADILKVNVFSTEDFGHGVKRAPWMLGAQATLSGRQLSWKYIKE